ncbi:MAG: MerR family transcriptional regulator [Flavobacteriales bacterium]
MNVKSQFSIKDLEHLSGVKAHTIRIWEKRYSLLEPQRTSTNIRTYTIENLKRLLNITFLYNDGLKISKIASLQNETIHELVEKRAIANKEEFAIKAFKTSMFELNEGLFNKTFQDLEAHKTLSEIFLNVFMPFLMDIGSLWQTSVIRPSHESFITELIKRKLLLHIEMESQKAKDQGNPLFILFLPYKEVHELGILFTNYEILSTGFQTIYLGVNTSLDSLKDLIETNRDIVYVSYLTMRPEGMSLIEYVDIFQTTVSNGQTSNLWLLGKKSKTTDLHKLASNVSIINGFPELTNRLEKLKENSQKKSRAAHHKLRIL